MSVAGEQLSNQCSALHNGLAIYVSALKKKKVISVCVLENLRIFWNVKKLFKIFIYLLISSPSSHRAFAKKKYSGYNKCVSLMS